MGIKFYEKHGYHTRGLIDIKKINWGNVMKKEYYEAYEDRYKDAYKNACVTYP